MHARTRLKLSLFQDCWEIGRSKAGLQVAAAVKKQVLPSSEGGTCERNDMMRSEAFILVHFIDRVLVAGELHKDR